VRIPPICLTCLLIILYLVVPSIAFGQNYQPIGQPVPAPAGPILVYTGRQAAIGPGKEVQKQKVAVMVARNPVIEKPNITASGVSTVYSGDREGNRDSNKR
jgi:hypothetical protein